MHLLSLTIVFFIFCRMEKVLSLELCLGALLVHDQSYREFIQILQTTSIGLIQNCNPINSSPDFKFFEPGLYLMFVVMSLNIFIATKSYTVSTESVNQNIFSVTFNNIIKPFV